MAFPEADQIAAELSGTVTPSGTTAIGPEAATAGTGRWQARQAPRTPPTLTSGLPMEEASSLVTEAAERLWTPEGDRGPGLSPWPWSEG